MTLLNKHAASTKSQAHYFDKKEKNQSNYAFKDAYFLKASSLCTFLHAGPGEGTKLHARKNFCVFYPIELKLCTMIEILIPNNRIVFVF